MAMAARRRRIRTEKGRADPSDSTREGKATIRREEREKEKERERQTQRERETDRKRTGAAEHEVAGVGSGRRHGHNVELWCGTGLRARTLEA